LALQKEYIYHFYIYLLPPLLLLRDHGNGFVVGICLKWICFKSRHVAWDLRKPLNNNKSIVFFVSHIRGHCALRIEASIEASASDAGDGVMKMIIIIIN